MFCNTDDLAGLVRSAEMRSYLTSSLAEWIQEGLDTKMRPTSRRGIRPEEHYAWLSRAFQAGDWFRAEVPPSWRAGYDPLTPVRGDDPLKVGAWTRPAEWGVTSFAEWTASMRILHRIPNPGGDLHALPDMARGGGFLFFLADWEAARPPQAKWRRPDGSAGERSLLQAKSDRSFHLQYAALVGSILASGVIGAGLPQSNPAWSRLAQVCQATMLGGFEYWDDFLAPLERGMRGLIPRVWEAGLTLRDPLTGAPVREWSDLWAGLSGAALESYAVRMAAQLDFFTFNLGALLDFIHQESGIAPLTEAGREEVLRCALLGWTAARGPAPLYGRVWYEEDEDSTAHEYGKALRVLRDGGRR